MGYKDKCQVVTKESKMDINGEHPARPWTPEYLKAYYHARVLEEFERGGEMRVPVTRKDYLPVLIALKVMVTGEGDNTKAIEIKRHSVMRAFGKASSTHFYHHELEVFSAWLHSPYAFAEAQAIIAADLWAQGELEPMVVETAEDPDEVAGQLLLLEQAADEVVYIEGINGESGLYPRSDFEGFG